MNIIERTGKKEIRKVEPAVGKARKAIIGHIPGSRERKKLEQLCVCVCVCVRACVRACVRTCVCVCVCVCFPSERTPVFSSTRSSVRPTLRSRHLILCPNVPTR